MRYIVSGLYRVNILVCDNKIDTFYNMYEHHTTRSTKIVYNSDQFGLILTAHVDFSDWIEGFWPVKHMRSDILLSAYFRFMPSSINVKYFNI